MKQGGTSAAFFREFAWIRDAGSHIRASEVQMFWETAPFHDIELLMPLVEELEEAVQNWKAAFKLREEEEEQGREDEGDERADAGGGGAVREGIEKPERRAL